MEGLEGDDRQVNRDIVRYFESQKSDDNEDSPHVPESPRPSQDSPRVPESPHPRVPSQDSPRVPESPRPSQDSPRVPSVPHAAPPPLLTEPQPWPPPWTADGGSTWSPSLLSPVASHTEIRMILLTCEN
ncbi:hypothetical protein AB1E18_007069 [Capra hircus]